MVALLLRQCRRRGSRHPRSRGRRRPRYRAGLTLYEVVLSLAIFLGALMVLSELISTASRAAVRAQLQTRANILCESKLSEVLAGAEPMRPVDDVAVDGERDGWSWSLAVEAAGQPDLLRVTVSVAHRRTDGAKDVVQSLDRLVRDPAALLDASEEDDDGDSRERGARRTDTGGA